MNAAFIRCIDRINRAAGRELSDDELNAIFDAVERATEGRRLSVDALAERAWTEHVEEAIDRQRYVAVRVIAAAQPPEVQRTLPTLPRPRMKGTPGATRVAVAELLDALRDAPFIGHAFPSPLEDLSFALAPQEHAPAAPAPVLARELPADISGSRDPLMREALRWLPSLERFTSHDESGKTQGPVDDFLQGMKRATRERQIRAEVFETAAHCFLGII
jgi:hypothetical protein